MKRTLTVTAACVALAFPVMAQTTNGQSQPQQQEDRSSVSADRMTGSQAQRVDPTQLSKEQIRQIQTRLNNAGFNAKAVDGVWGDNTRQALRNYQKQQNLPGDGELNQQTLSALGVEVAATGDSQANGTAATGAGAGTRAAPPEPGANEPDSGSRPAESPNQPEDQKRQ
jgi:peptidoglycan hydrolase-like protein with peptidoglycan-binding domain